MVDFSEKEFDVIVFARKIMSEIEGVRSFKKVRDDKTGAGFQLPTETRINAFFRLIGFPYFVTIKGEKTESSFIHPNFSTTVRAELADKVVFDSDQEYTYVDGSINPINKVLADRVNELNKIESNVGTKESNTKVAKAMYAPLDIAPNVPDKPLGTGVFVPTIPPKGGNDTENTRSVFKKLFPLIPSITDNESYKVLPLRNEIARPFVTDIKGRTVDRDTILRKPFLEQVIRIRFLKFESSKTESEKTLDSDMTASIKQLLGDETYSNIFGDSNLFAKVNILEEFIINKFINAVINLARRWSKTNENRIRLLRKIKPTINIKTSSSRTSQFGKKVDLSVDLSGTSEGEKLNTLNQMIAKDEALIALLPSDEDEGTTVKKSNTRNISPNALQNPFVDMLTYNLQKNKESKTSIEGQIKRDIKNLEKIRLEIVDLMTGEFTGLSITDVVMVIASLFIVDKIQLLNLLDKYAIDDMKNDDVLSTIIKDVTPSAEKAMRAVEEIENIVEQLFSLFYSELDSVNNRKRKGTEGKPKTVYNDKSSDTPNASACTIYKEGT